MRNPQIAEIGVSSSNLKQDLLKSLSNMALAISAYLEDPCAGLDDPERQTIEQYQDDRKERNQSNALHPRIQLPSLRCANAADYGVGPCPLASKLPRQVFGMVFKLLISAI